MQVKLPYFYVVIHRRDDLQTAERPQMDFLDCDIKEPNRSEIETAARWRRRTPDNPLEINCVSWRGNLYLQRTTSNSTRHLQAADLLEGCHGGIHRLESLGAFLDPMLHGPNRHYFLYQWLENKSRAFAKPRGGTIAATTEEDDIERIRYVADRTIILDDCVFQRVSGLRCNLYAERAPDTYLIHADVDYTLNDGKTWKRSWDDQSHHWADGCSISLNRLSDDLQWNGEPVRPKLHNLEVFMPEAFTFDSRAHYLARTVAKFERETRHMVGEWPSDMLSDWLALRRELENTPLNTDAVISQLEAMTARPVGMRAIQVLEEGFKGFEKLERLLQSDEPIGTLTTRLHLR